ncbi:hypothetical protein [Algibacillus agarilyticus]|uniref:hypothetical protein n=1 Tax=Algibacillus agarilyticus TaxID=2234133 RepID=UPI00130046E8|nr:hypothetical protein [Algibacillus agarilyticus]
MLTIFRKKNADYNQNEKRITAGISFVLFFLFGFLYTDSLAIENGHLLFPFPYLVGFLLGVIVGLIGYRYPKVIHLTVFALPLMFVGS